VLYRSSGKIQRLNEVEPLNRDADAAETNGGPRFHILNTNKRHSIESHQRMLKERIAAAFYGAWKLNIDRIRKNGMVFLHENGKGIVAYGKGTGETLKAEYEGTRMNVTIKYCRISLCWRSHCPPRRSERSSVAMLFFCERCRAHLTGSVCSKIRGLAKGRCI
jgi:hypothetical protein